jgi:hypothetical protein
VIRSSPQFIRRYGSPTAAAEAFADKAISNITLNLDHPALSDIQGLCLVIIHEWGSRNAVRAYIYLGQAARMMHMYRILNSHHPDTTGNFLWEESFRRTLWLLYILDCLLTAAPGRCAALSPQDTADVPLPCSDINFAFGNTVYVKTLFQQMDPAGHPASPHATGEVGEFGYIVMATTIWRGVVTMLMRTTLQNFSEEDCTELLKQIETLRASLPMQFVDKPGQISLHMTMGSGYTFAVLHCLLHCATIFIHRRRLLQEVTVQNFDIESFRRSPKCHDIVDRLFTSCHSTISLLTAVEAGVEKDNLTCFPIFMLFASFTASATVAYLSLKGLNPPNSGETAAAIVKDGLRFMQDGTESWPLMSSWLRHLTVMQRVLNNDAAAPSSSTPNPPNAPNAQLNSGAYPSGSGVKDEVASNADTNPDVMDYDRSSTGGGIPPHPQPRHVSELARGDSEPPAAIPRRPGIATINGGSAALNPPPTRSPGPTSAPRAPSAAMQVTDVKEPSPADSANDFSGSQQSQTTSQDMTGPELCEAFERQLLDLDDLAAFMGGGV